jgi:hypothetical protein
MTRPLLRDDAPGSARAAPERLRGVIEVRGSASSPIPVLDDASLALARSCVPRADVPRSRPARIEALGRTIPGSLHAHDARARVASRSTSLRRLVPAIRGALERRRVTRQRDA